MLFASWQHETLVEQAVPLPLRKDYEQEMYIHLEIRACLRDVAVYCRLHQNTQYLCVQVGCRFSTEHLYEVQQTEDRYSGHE